MLNVSHLILYSWGAVFLILLFNACVSSAEQLKTTLRFYSWKWILTRTSQCAKVWTWRYFPISTFIVELRDSLNPFRVHLLRYLLNFCFLFLFFFFVSSFRLPGRMLNLMIFIVSLFFLHLRKLVVPSEVPTFWKMGTIVCVKLQIWLV